MPTIICPQLLGFACGNVRGKQDKFICRLPRHHRQFAHHFGNAFGYPAQQIVADFMAHHVVDRLEAVQIDKHHRQLAVRAALSSRASSPAKRQSGWPGR